MRGVLLIIGVLVGLQAKSSNFLESKGPQARALGGASITLANPWACFNNQAALSFVEHLEIGISIAQLFNIEQLTQAQMAIALPLKQIGVLGLSLDHTAIPGVFSQQRMGLSFSRKFSQTFAVGMQIEAFHLNLFSYGSKWLVNAHLGFLYKPTKQLNLGFYLQNPYGALLLEPFNERLPVVARMGGSYAFSNDLSFYTEVSLSPQQKARLHAGISYMLNDKFSLRTGITTSNISTAFGLDISLEHIRILLAFSYHQTLGSTPELGMAYVAN